MSKKLLACAAGALGLMLASSTFQPAAAKSHGGNSYGGKSYSHVGHVGHVGHPFVNKARFVHDRRFRRHHHNRIFVAYSDYGYANDCYWLRRKALYTGSSYWWNRYYACTSGY